MGLGLITCGRLLLVAEVEEREEEEGQEESWEVESGVQGEEVAHMDGIHMTVRRRSARLEPNLRVMKCAREVKLCAHSCALSVDVLVGVHVVKRHAIVDVQCVLVIRVVIGVHVHLYNLLFHFRFQFSLLYNSSNSFPRSHFSHMFSLYSHGILGVVFTPTVGYSRRRQL